MRYLLLLALIATAHAETNLPLVCTAGTECGKADRNFVLPSADSLVWQDDKWVAYSSATSALVCANDIEPGTNTADCARKVTVPKSEVAAPSASAWVAPAKVSWVAPTKNTDGSDLTDLAGYRIEYGSSQSALTREVSLLEPAATDYTIPDLEAGTWYFTVRAVAASGEESDRSQTVSLAITQPAEECPGPPEDEARDVSCQAPLTGSWQQIRSYTQLAYPTCWTPGEWQPETAPNGACAEIAENWSVGSAPVTRPVYEAVQNRDGTSIVRGGEQGRIEPGKPCGAEAFTSGRYSYRYVAENDIDLDSQTYRGRTHVAVCSMGALD